MSEAARPGWYQDPQGAAGTLRYWDGERWTEHRREHPETVAERPDPGASGAAGATGASAVAPEPADAATAAAPAPAEPKTEPLPVQPAEPVAPEPGEGAGQAEKGPVTGGIAQGIVVGLVVAALAVLLIAVTIGLPDSGEEPGATTPDAAQTESGGATEPEGSPQALARSAQEAIEIYANDNGGSYEGASPEALAAVDPELDPEQIAVSSTQVAFTVTAIDGEAAFSISRGADGTVTLSCEPPGREGCPGDGDWS